VAAPVLDGLGIFQTLYRGSPISSYVDVGRLQRVPGLYEAVQVQDLTQIHHRHHHAVGTPYGAAAWYNQTDLNFQTDLQLREVSL